MKVVLSCFVNPETHLAFFAAALFCIAGPVGAQEDRPDTRTTEEIRSAAEADARRHQARMDQLLANEPREDEFADRVEAVARKRWVMRLRSERSSARAPSVK